ncbi:MAG: 4-phosphoerythronate dehydrogenase PdxB [Planctomycetota bacterium]|nr:4-phosphoerythronate dehydrogenase PdxB [Planctomycetota bacterium]
MKIVADANIPLLAEAVGPLGEVTALPAERLTADAVRDADALLVRSVTKVDKALLAGSRVRFVATATIGFDHIDQAYLAAQGIGFAYAPGSNARSVAEYVLAAVFTLAEKDGFRVTDKVLGIVGCGNVGGRLARLAEGIGMRVLRNDPPLARKTGDPKYVPIEALAAADIVTFHVPLERGGPDPTHHMISDARLAAMKRGVTILNSSRGSVADSAALKRAMDAGRLGSLVLDVWEGEPNIDLDLLGRARLATPHIAGYSYDGKINGTRMVMEAMCRHFGLVREWDPAPLMPPPAVPRVLLAKGVAVQQALRQAIRAAYDIEADDGRLREVGEKPVEERGKFFSALRKKYAVRREFASMTVELAAADAALEAAFKALDFGVAVGSHT